MKAPDLTTEISQLRLIEPNVERDAALGVAWLNGELGRATLQSMGNGPEVIAAMLPATLAQEQARVRDFLKRNDQLNWMIEHKGHVVGAVWVDLAPREALPSPSVHIMIGEPNARGKGLGTATIRCVLEYLEQQGKDTVYSRHLTTNLAAGRLLKSLGFTELGKPYQSDALEFQNLVRTTSK